jgi:hypothetical protein
MVADENPAPQPGKYARYELERRWLVERLPERADAGSAIVDRYIEGTRLRLRHAEAPHVQYKLSQKEAPAPPDYARAVITTIYLSGKEYEVFAALPASELRKRRHHLCRYSIDVSRRDRIRDGEGNASARRSRLRRQRRVARRPLQGWLAGRERVAIAVIL